MESLSKLNLRHQPLHLSINPHRPSSLIPISSFRPLRSSSFSSLKIRASSADPPHQAPQNPKPSFLQTLSPLACAAVAAAAFFTMRFHPTKPAFAAPTSTVEPAKVTYEDEERQIEEQLSRDPNDVEALRSLMEVRIKAHKLTEAVQVLDRLIEVEPEDFEWQLLKANVHTYMGEYDLATSEFEDILAKDPLRVEAYHGLVMSASQSEEKLELVLKRVEKAMEACKKQGNTSDVRDFKLLIAQIRVMEAEYKDALELYQELVKEEPRDFRPYLCQGIIYTLLRKKNEAEKHFATFRKLVPKNHPYKEYFDDNMFATKLFGAKVEREAAGSNV
ncbi:PREDICTED: protein SLOW GREEN 1, chloroplastic [Fragaria vesca subsp. vesca]|uniref:protein SLOW GREEN 1, chloroplastic n=1 Tax=Fragaria vesca subsp. vesca TaxID=101020 RepID=UPI0002C2E509|nr:PREDICTED: protein SLOW GREEN 1, chloroplastic [Fragaria vesca subsp. vesca]